MSAPATRYHRVYLRQPLALCAPALLPDASMGCWVGRAASQPSTAMAELLHRAACDLSSQAWVASHSPLGLVVATSKGDMGLLSAALGGQPARFRSAWPDAGHQPLGPLLRRLGRPIHLLPPPVAACSTGMMALLGVADAIEAGWVAEGVCLAADASVHPWLVAGFARMGVLCPLDARPTAFSVQGTGFAISEGAARVCLADQMAQGRPGWQLVAGVRLADASHPTRFGDDRVLHACLEALHHHAGQPDLIITHGTGTAAGDAYETAVLDAGPWRSATRIAYKPQIGHCLGASGLVELCLGLEEPYGRTWKLSLGFGGHLAAVAVERVG